MGQRGLRLRTRDGAANREEIVSGLEFINANSAWTLALMTIGLSVTFSVGMQLLTRWCYGVDLVEANHEVAGFKFAVVGVAYGVVLAFVVVSVWDSYERTNGNAEVEAERIYNLFRTTYNFPVETGKNMQRALIDYAIEVRDKDCPAMKKGIRGSTSATAAFNKLSLTVGRTKVEDIGLVPSLNHAINLLQQIVDLRLERLSDIRGAGDTADMDGLADGRGNYLGLLLILRHEACGGANSHDRRPGRDHRFHFFPDACSELSFFRPERGHGGADRRCDQAHADGSRENGPIRIHVTRGTAVHPQPICLHPQLALGGRSNACAFAAAFGW